MFKFGIESLLSDREKVKYLQDKRVALVGHPASVDQKLKHSQDILFENDISLSSCFGPQHGMRGEKQDNMIESDHFTDPVYGIPVFSLYGEVRRPTQDMLDTFDVLLIDLQDVGCRIYTFLTTLFYLMEACADHNKEIIVLDRPNPAGRTIEGLTLNMDYASFVGAAPVSMRHGLTLGEAALWYKAHKDLNLNLSVQACENYLMGQQAWPEVLSWVNPSPNLPRLSGVLAYAGTVLIEGTTLSEGRGTTTPLELMAGPDLDASRLIDKMQELNNDWLKGVVLRPCFFEPTFQKHKHNLCSGFQIHTDHPSYDPCLFSPYRLTCLAFKAVRALYPDYNLWISPPYEYEKDKMPIDILSGSSFLRQWVDNPEAKVEDLELELQSHERQWLQDSQPFYLYE